MTTLGDPLNDILRKPKGEYLKVQFFPRLCDFSRMACIFDVLVSSLIFYVWKIPYRSGRRFCRRLLHEFLELRDFGFG